MRAAGRVVAEAIREMARRVRPGVTTAELDDVAAGVFARHGARSGPQLDYDFPGVTCISLDDEAVHGIPSSKRRIREGQLVKLDVTAELDGFYADACRTVAAGRASPVARGRNTTTISVLFVAWPPNSSGELGNGRTSRLRKKPAGVGGPFQVGRVRARAWSRRWGPALSRARAS